MKPSRSRSRTRTPRLVSEAGSALARWAHLRADAPRAAKPVLSPPPLPSMDRRLRDLQARGYGSLSRTFTAGLTAQGVSTDVAQRELSARVRDGRLVPRVGGGWSIRA